MRKPWRNIKNCLGKVEVTPTRTRACVHAASRVPVSALRSLLDEAFRSIGVELKTKYEFSQAQTLISMASAGIGVAILPESVLPSRENGSAQILEIQEPASDAKWL